MNRDDRAVGVAKTKRRSDLAVGLEGKWQVAEDSRVIRLKALGRLGGVVKGRSLA